MKKRRSILMTLIIVLAVIIYAVFFQPHNTPEPLTQTEQNNSGTPQPTNKPTRKPTAAPKPTKKPTAAPRSANTLTVTFINVGQGDSTLIQQGGSAILIDTGVYAQRQNLLNELDALGVTSLDCVIATHPDSDHIGSMDVIIDTYDVKRVMMPNITANTVAFEKMLQSIDRKGLRIDHPVPGKSIQAGKIKLDILAPNSAKYPDDNDYSIVTRLQWGKNSFIFQGDAETLSEKEILGKGFNVSADVIKVGHHGSVSSTSEEYLNAVHPRMAVISCGAGNPYGHPHQETLDKLNARNIAVYRTDTMGTITMRSDGTNITVETEK